MTNEQMERMKNIYWWHDIEVEPGVFTGGAIKDMKQIATRIMGMPENLTGKSVIDVGGWNGGYSFIAEQRGAKDILMVDIFQNKEVGAIDGFNLAKEMLGSKVEFKELGVYDLSPDSVGMFDVVMFYGVFYHIDDCLKAMKNLYSITKEQCILETALCRNKDLLCIDTPVAEWQYGYNNDKYNKWHPNFAFIHKMATDVGFKKVEQVFLHPNKSRATFRLIKELT